MDDDRSDGVVRHWHAGRSQVQISTALGLDRKTIRKYLAPALAAGLSPGDGGKFDENLWRELITSWFPKWWTRRRGR